ncbi:MAG: hypothetical protein QOE92_2315 [Chloroflexota bacterium]|nr:hypothetical protein [Chloroflexota bacterium]
MSRGPGALRVGLDATPAIVGMSGLRHYAAVTVNTLRARDDVDLHVFGAGRGPAPEVSLRRLPVPLRVLQASWRLTGRPRAEDVVGDVDVVHSLDLMPPPTRRPLVVTVMDALALTHPQFFTERVRAEQEVHLAAARRAEIVVTGCQATADELARVGDIDPARLMVTPYGRLPRDDVAAPGRAHPGPYLLSVSTVEPRKGYELLAEAVAKLPGCPPVLVAGPDGYRGEEIRTQAEAIAGAGRVRFLGDVRDPARLAALYRDATLVVQPSHAEGFGFPVLEAMGVGAAVLASDIPQAVEVGGDAVEVFRAGDAESLAAALERLLADDARRAELGRRARERAAESTWERTAEHLVRAYRRAAGARGD